MSAEGKDFEVNVEGKGFFVHRVRDMVDIMKEYTVKNANQILQDFNEAIQTAVDALMVQAESLYIKKYDAKKANET